jgi:DNA-binding response OmpR family regulator
MNKVILIVDDKLSMLHLLRDYLSENHFRVVVASNGRDALYMARHEQPDLILLDIMMPHMDGFAFLRAYRHERDTPVILLTARLEEHDKVIGLELGADDYVTKPFGMAELMARIRAVLRRCEQPNNRDVLRAGGLTLDHVQHTVYHGDRLIHLTPTEFELLGTLMAAPGRVFSRLDLLEALKGDTLQGVERTIDVHVRNLRAKLEPNPSEPRFVQTVFGVGYRFAADAQS